MKKWLKRIALACVLLLFLSPFIFGFGIVIGNNMVANRVAKDLQSYPLPAQMVWVDSVSAAGKFVGNGNGMQYIGAILIAGDVNKEDILEHYSKEFDYIEVYRQTSRTIQAIPKADLRFDKYEHNSDKRYYSVICWGSEKNYVNNIFSRLLQLDLRGH